MILEIETIDALPAFHRKSVPDIHQRKSLEAGNAARIVVLVNGAVHVACWVKIATASAGIYSGCTDHDYGEIPAGSPFDFTWQHVVDWI